ncbi:helix-turn-helix transcriptional regulator [Levilactobacillus enshiensis]|uniref:helix-turn-helix transcriptional regulator n=1 Tax=Levilactobacillus enshiensis TaxID=2590213 RepID=UPI00117B8F20|nr:helix-turn-helix transcriptional regulator [Levilactobacillus enshiensis]
MEHLKLQAALIAHRKQHHWTQADLAERLFLSRQTISNWENGRTYPDIQSLILLANLYQVTVDDLVKEDLTTMQSQTTKHHLKLLVTATIVCLILVYGLFIGLRWLPLIPTVMAIAAVTTIGLTLAGYLIYLSQHLQLKTFRQINAYLRHQPAPKTTSPHAHQIVVLTLSALVGLIIGGTLTWWIATTILHWSL